MMSTFKFDNTHSKVQPRIDRQLFNTSELRLVDDAACTSEELVNNHFKLSTSQWLKNRYDIQTAKDLSAHEILDGPYAQVVKYEGRRREVPLGSTVFNFYKVCIQDGPILDAVQNSNLQLEPFLIYILTHELIHVVRFSQFEQRYEKKNESDLTFEEERKVHTLTHEILRSTTVHGIDQIFDFYRDWL